MLVCPHCGTQLASRAHSCSSCGRAADPVSSAANPVGGGNAGGQLLSGVSGPAGRRPIVRIGLVLLALVFLISAGLMIQNVLGQGGGLKELLSSGLLLILLLLAALLRLCYRAFRA